MAYRIANKRTTFNDFIVSIPKRILSYCKRQNARVSYACYKKGMVLPRVSVLTPIYNTNPVYLRQCIESILSQTYTDFEFIILNDSPDNTALRDIVLSYDDMRICYVENSCNMGISAARNKLIDMARGQYLAIFDHDDISHPTRLATQVEFLDANPHIGVVGTWAHWFGERDFIRKNPVCDTDIKIRLTDVCAIMHSSCMIRRCVLEKNNIRYEDEYTPAEDYRLFGRLMTCTNFYNLPNVLLEYRCVHGNTSSLMSTKMAQAHESIKIQICNMFPMYRMAFERKFRRVRLRLFGKIPLIKIKNHWVLLFDFIPLIKIKD